MSRTWGSRGGEPSGRLRLRRRSIRIPEAAPEADTERLIAGYTQTIRDELDSALHSFERATTLMARQMASEVGHVAPEAPREREEYLPSVDDTVRGVLTHTDERIQALNLRVVQMETTMRELAEATREAVRRIGRRPIAVASEEGKPTQVEDLRGLLEDTIRPLAGRIETLSSALEEGESPDRNDLIEFSERVGRGVSEATRRIQDGFAALADRAEDTTASAARRVESSVRSEIGRLEGAVRSEQAFAIDELAQLRASIDAVAERTGTVLEIIRSDLGTRIDALAGADLEQAIGPLGERIEDLRSSLTETVDPLGERIEGLATALNEAERGHVHRMEALTEALTESQERHRQDLKDFSQRIGHGLSEITRRIQDGLDSVVERASDSASSAAGETSGRIEALEAAQAQYREELTDFSQRIGQGLGEVAKRIQAGFEVVLDRAGSSNLEPVARLEDSVGKVYQLITAAVDRLEDHQSRNLDRLADGLRLLLEAVRESGGAHPQTVAQILQSTAGRQEAILEECVTILRSAIKELAGVYSKPGNGHEKPDGEGEGFARRLRGAEERLQRLSQELSPEPQE